VTADLIYTVVSCGHGKEKKVTKCMTHTNNKRKPYKLKTKPIVQTIWVDSPFFTVPAKKKFSEMQKLMPQSLKVD